MVYNIMPTYIFECYEEKGGCSHTFELIATMGEASSLAPKCPKCNKKKPVARSYRLQTITVRDNTPKTLGELATKNAKRLSTDEKAHLKRKHTAYMDKAFTGSLPEGASQYPVDAAGNKVGDRSQTKRPKPRRKPSQ